LCSFLSFVSWRDGCDGNPFFDNYAHTHTRMLNFRFVSGHRQVGPWQPREKYSLVVIRSDTTIMEKSLSLMVFTKLSIHITSLQSVFMHLTSSIIADSSIPLFTNYWWKGDGRHRSSSSKYLCYYYVVICNRKMTPRHWTPLFCDWTEFEWLVRQLVDTMYPDRIQVELYCLWIKCCGRLAQGRVCSQGRKDFFTVWLA